MGREEMIIPRRESTQPDSADSPPESNAGLDLSPSTEETPLQYYGPSPAWRLVDVADIWRHRELLGMLAVRDVKVRYRQALVGIAWVVLQPLATSLVFVFLFGLLGHTPKSGHLPYGVFVLSGTVIWQMFAGTLTQATNSLVVNQHLIGKVYFPRLLLPMASALANMVDFSVGMVVLFAVMAWYGIWPSWPIVCMPIFALLGVVCALAAGIWMSALNAMYRDAGLLVPFALQIGFFISPVVYATDFLIPEPWRPLLALNPMCGVVEGFRWSVLGVGDPPIKSAAASVVVAGLVLLTGLVYFRRIEGVLADRI